jgi:hypothetical protein
VIRAVARGAALLAAAVDLAGAWAVFRGEGGVITVRRAALATAVALVPCALSFATVVAARLRRAHWRRGGVLRLPIAVPRGYLGAAVLGGIAGLTAMGERFGLFVFLAGVALIALALSQAQPRRA